MLDIQLLIQKTIKQKGMFWGYLKKNTMLDLSKQRLKLGIVEVREVSRPCMNLEAKVRY